MSDISASDSSETILTIVIPCYNEAASLESIYSKVNHCLNVCDKLQFILLNNGSEDSSQYIFSKLRSISSHSNLQFVSLSKNKGYGYGIKSCLPLAKGSYVGWTHGDNQTDIFDVIRFYSLILDITSHSGVLPSLAFKGVRYARPVLDSFISASMSIIASIIYFPYMMSEINAQPSIYHSSLFQSLDHLPDDYNIDSYCWIRARLSNFSVYRIPVLFPPRKYGKSSWNFSFISKIKFIYLQLSFLLKNRFIYSIFLGH